MYGGESDPAVLLLLAVGYGLWAGFETVLQPSTPAVASRESGRTALISAGGTFLGGL